MIPSHQLMFLSSRLRLNVNEQNNFKQLISRIENWDEYVKFVIAHQAGPMMYNKVKSLSLTQNIPNTALAMLHQSWFKTLGRSMVLIEHFRNAMDAFNKAGLTVIAMKGIYLSDYLYSEVGLRQFSDIDLLLKPAEALDALVILKNLGYSSSTIYMADFYKKNNHKNLAVHYPPMILNGVSIEIHTRLYSKNLDFDVEIHDLFDHAIVKKVHGVNAFVFSPEDLLINLCLHLEKHFRGGGFQFTGFYDISNILDRFNEILDVEKLVNICKKNSIEKYVYKYFQLCNIYFLTPLPVISEIQNYLPDNKDHLLFNKRLQQGRSYINFFDTYGKNLQSFTKLSDKFRYVLHFILPSSDYLKHRYQIKSNLLLPMYYFLRVYLALKISFNALQGSIYNKFKNMKHIK